jgi:hypothetical protein
MSTKRVPLPETRFAYSGGAVGAAGRITKLYDSTDLNILIPAQAVVGLPVTGGLSEASVENYSFTVSEPKPVQILSIGSLASRAYGRLEGSTMTTDVSVEVSQADVIEKLHVDTISMQITSQCDPGEKYPRVTPNAVVAGLKLGSTEVRVTLDLSVFQNNTTKEALTSFFEKDPAYWRSAPWRFNARETDPTVPQYNGGTYICSVVSNIELASPSADIEVDGYNIYWKNFGRIVIGEILITDFQRRLTMLRLELGCDIGGGFSIPDGSGNGSFFP